MGEETNPRKVEALMNWPFTTNVKELRSFLGLAGYYKRFIRSYEEKSRPLKDLLKKRQYN